MAQRTILEQAKSLVLKLTADRPVSVYLFGSRVKETFGRYSDIDLAVLPEGSMPVGLMGSLKSAFEESNIPYSVDVIDLSRADEAFRTRVISEGILWKDCKSDSKPPERP